MALQGEIPKKIKMGEQIFIYDSHLKDWIKGNNKGIMDLKNTIDSLTETVEIIEENGIRKIECYELKELNTLNNVKFFFKDRFNELIDVVNEMRKEK